MTKCRFGDRIFAAVDVGDGDAAVGGFGDDAGNVDVVVADDVVVRLVGFVPLKRGV